MKEARLRDKDSAIWRGRIGLMLVVDASVESDRSTPEPILVGGPFERDRVAPLGDPGSPRARRPARVESRLFSIETNSLMPHEVRVMVPWRSVRSMRSRCWLGLPSS